MSNDTSGNNDIIRKVIELAAEHGGVSPDQVVRETHFIDDLNYDSLTSVEFIMDLEDEFDIQVPDAAADSIKTVGQAIDLTLERLQSPESSSA